MLRFDDNPARRPRNYLLRREQTRLLLMVGALGLVLLAMQRVQSPDVVAKLDDVFGEGSPGGVEEGVADSPSVVLTPLDRALFASVKDNAPFREAESGAWFATLGALQGIEGKPGPGEVVTYAQLSSQPEAYRGQPVEVRGTVRRVEEVEAGKNERGIEKLYRVILQPTGGEVWPITIYALEPPADHAEQVASRAAGYFFKKQSYRWEGGLGSTPVVLAKSIDSGPAPLPSEATEAAPPDVSTILIAAIGISAVMIAFFVLRSGGDPSSALADSPTPQFDELTK